MRIRVISGFCFALLIYASIGCQPHSGVDANLEVPDELMLYSIDGRYFEEGQELKTEETFYKYPVLGKIAVTDPDKRKEIIDALNEGMRTKEQGKACFIPRHAVHTVHQGKVVDYVICFQCGYVDVYDGGNRKVEKTTSTPQALFNQHLKEAGIPLSP